MKMVWWRYETFFYLFLEESIIVKVSCVCVGCPTYHLILVSIFSFIVCLPQYIEVCQLDDDITVREWVSLWLKSPFQE